MNEITARIIAAISAAAATVPQTEEQELVRYFFYTCAGELLATASCYEGVAVDSANGKYHTTCARDEQESGWQIAAAVARGATYGNAFATYAAAA